MAASSAPRSASSVRAAASAPVLAVDVAVSAVAPIGIFLGRLANFIKPELWGRPTDVPWAMIFPGSDGLPRHPSQLYEARLEGVALFVVLFIRARAGALSAPGADCRRFSRSAMALARIICEFFRDPDPKLECPSAARRWACCCRCRWSSSALR